MKNLFTPNRGVELIHAGRVAASGAWRTALGCHSHHELICVLRGCLRARNGKQQLEGRPGDLLLYPQGVMHEERADESGPLEILFMGFRCAYGGRRELSLLRDTHRRVAEILRWLHEDTLEGGAMPRAEKQSLLSAILEGISHAETADALPDWVRRVRRRLLADLSRPATLEELAQTAGMSQFHFLRRYKTATGRTPMADMRMMRLQHARQLIQVTSLPIKEIASLAGFGSLQSMTRAFTRDLGTPPARLRGGAGV